MKANFMLFGLMVLSLVACKELEDINGSYEVFSINGQDITGEGVTINIDMSESENRISGNNGCNQYSGTFENPEANDINLGPMMGTKMYCQEKADLEKLFMSQLSLVKKVEANNGTLKMMDENGTVLIKAEKKDE